MVWGNIAFTTAQQMVGREVISQSQFLVSQTGAWFEPVFVTAVCIFIYVLILVIFSVMWLYTSTHQDVQCIYLCLSANLHNQSTFYTSGIVVVNYVVMFCLLSFTVDTYIYIYGPHWVSISPEPHVFYHMDWSRKTMQTCRQHACNSIQRVTGPKFKPGLAVMWQC